MNVHLSGYDKTKGELLKRLKGKKIKTHSLDVDEIPAGWTVVHLYLDKNEDKELRINPLIGQIAPYDDSKVIWQAFKTIKAKHIWESYEKWLKKYRREPKKLDSRYELENLCQVIGEYMSFLFQIGKKIIFIPHGFTHLLPLHAAKNGESYLFQKAACIYLPAWSLVSGDVVQNGHSREGNYCIRYFPAKENKEYYKELYDNPLWGEKNKMDGENADLLSLESVFKNNPPRYLTLLWLSGNSC